VTCDEEEHMAVGDWDPNSMAVTGQKRAREISHRFRNSAQAETMSVNVSNVSRIQGFLIESPGITNGIL
jgi:hypothetical protein